MFIIVEQHIVLNMQKREEEILNQALTALENETNLSVEKEIPLHQQFALPLGEDIVVDAIVRLGLPEKPVEYRAKVKPALTNVTVGQIAHQFSRNLQQWLLVTRTVHPQLAKAMRQLHVQFIDTAGNAYIDAPPAFILIEGRKRQVQASEASDEGVLGRAGLRVVFAFMCRRDVWNATYRDIAKVARVALGTAAGVMKDLTAQGYLVEKAGGQRRLVRQKELLHKWTTAYAEKLRSKNVIGRYKSTRPELWRAADIQLLDAQWGSEVAANRLTHYLKPEITTIYARKPINNLVLELKLRQDRNGDIEVRERFWDFEMTDIDKTVVPPLLVYADLMATGDPRNIETAKMIYDDYLQRHFMED